MLISILVYPMASIKEYGKLWLSWLPRMCLVKCSEDRIKLLECYAILIKIFVQNLDLVWALFVEVQELTHLNGSLLILRNCEEIRIELLYLLVFWVKCPHG